MKAFEKEEKKDTLVAERTQGASCMYPLFWGRDGYDGFGAKN